MTLWPCPCVGNVSTPSSEARAASRSWVGPIHCPPTSTTLPPPMSWFSTRPPTRSRASTTTTDAPRALSSRAALRPASPAPTTTTSASCVRESGTAGLYIATLPRSHASRNSLSRARGGAPPQYADADDRKRRVGHGGCRHLAIVDRRHMGGRGDNTCPRDAAQRSPAPADRAPGARMDERPAGARQARRESARGSRTAPRRSAAAAECAPPNLAPRLGGAPRSESVAAGPVRVYRQPSARAPRRRFAWGTVAATAAIAFV